MDLQHFILRHIDSVDCLRTLLLLRREPSRAWSTMDVSARLYLEPRVAAAVLRSLETSGLLTQDDARCLRFDPQTSELRRLTEELAALDRERPVTLIKLIYSRQDSLEAFAEAFKLRRDD